MEIYTELGLREYIALDIDTITGIFDFKKNIEDSLEEKELKDLKDFFNSKSIPIHFNFYDIRSCCLSIDNELNEISKNQCLNVFLGFMKYRYFVMNEYLEKAIKEGLQNQEYVIGEIPLTKEQKLKRIEEKKKDKKKRPFSTFWYKASNPIYIYKGGHKKVVDHDNFEFPSDIYLQNEKNYISKLRDKLSSGCVISFFMASKCSQYVRLCYVNYDKAFKRFSAKIKIYGALLKTVGNDVLLRRNCAAKGYFFSCTNRKTFENMLNPEDGSNKENWVSEVIRLKTVRIDYDLSDNFNFKVKMKMATFHNNLVKNFHLQRMIFDNFNHRFQNDMMSSNLNGSCYTFGDCYAIYLTLSGFKDSNLEKNKLTGIEDVDFVFDSLDIQSNKEFKRNQLYISVAMSVFQMRQFWEKLKRDKVANIFEIENDINFEYGILSQFKDFLFDKEFYYPLIQTTISNLEDSTSYLFETFDSSKLDHIKISEEIANSVKDFYDSTKEKTDEIRKYYNEIKTKINLTDNLSMKEASIKKNEAYSLQTLEAIEEITHIQPDFGIALNYYSKFMLKTEVANSFAMDSNNVADSLYNVLSLNLAQRICERKLEATFSFIADAIHEYYENYPDFNKKNENHKHIERIYALATLAMKLNNVHDIIINNCMIEKNFKGIPMFLLDFMENGYLETIKFRSNEQASNFNYSYIKENMKENSKMPKIHEALLNAKILFIFGEVLDPVVTDRDAYFKLQNIQHIERNILGSIPGYEPGNKLKNTILITKTLSYLLLSMTLNFSLYSTVWNHLLETNILKKEKEEKKEESEKPKSTFNPLKMFGGINRKKK